MLRAMDAAQALADLTEISSQVVHVAVVDGDGAVLAATIGDAGRAERFVHGVTTLLEEADGLRQSRGLPSLSQLEAATLEGSVFIVRRDGRGSSPRRRGRTPRSGSSSTTSSTACARSTGASENGTRRRTRKKAGDAA